MKSLLVPGENEISLSFSGRYYQIGGNNTPVIEYSYGFSFYVYLNGDFIKKVPGNYQMNPFSDCTDAKTTGCPVYLKANPGDKIRLIGHCNWSMPNNYSHYLDDIWLSEVDNPEHKIRLIPAQWYGWATDSSPNIESPFDETFTIPDFED